MPETMHLGTVTVVRLIRPLALGHPCRSSLDRRPAPTGKAESIRGAHPRWPNLLTTERTSRPPGARAVWKTAVLSSSPPSPRGARPGRVSVIGGPLRWVFHRCGKVLWNRHGDGLPGACGARGVVERVGPRASRAP